MDLGRQRGILLDGEDPPKKVGCRKNSYFLEFMNVAVLLLLLLLLLLLVVVKKASHKAKQLLKVVTADFICTVKP